MDSEENTNLSKFQSKSMFDNDQPDEICKTGLHAVQQGVECPAVNCEVVLKDTEHVIVQQQTPGSINDDIIYAIDNKQQLSCNHTIDCTNSQQGLLITEQAMHIDRDEELLLHTHKVDPLEMEGHECHVNQLLGNSCLIAEGSVVDDVEDHDDEDEHDMDGDVFEAAQSGNTGMIQNYLDLGLPPELVDEQGWSILHYAASHGQTEVIKLLHSRGGCIDPVDEYGRTPLHHAAASGESESICSLVDFGSNVNAVDNEGNTPLKWAQMCQKHSAVSILSKLSGLQMIQGKNIQLGVEAEEQRDNSKLQNSLCISKGHTGVNSDRIVERQCLKVTGHCNPSEALNTATNSECRHSLHHSASMGNNEIVIKLLDEGLQLNLEDCHGNTALHCAAAGGHVEVIRELARRGASIDIQREDGWTPLHAAVSNNQLDAVIELCRHSEGPPHLPICSDKGTALHQAVLNGNKDLLSVLFSKGCPVDVLDSKGRSLLHWAATHGHVKLVKFIISKGLSPNTTDRSSCTPLHAAAASGHQEVILELVGIGGAELMTVVAGSRGTPLHQAVSAGHANAAQLLMDLGCPLSVVDSNGKSLIHKAAKYGRVELIQLLVGRGVDGNAVDVHGCTSLHDAAEAGKMESVESLITLCGKSSLTTVAGARGAPLHVAAAKGHHDVVSYLIKEGCPTDILSSSGETALHHAASAGRIEVVKTLIDLGSNVNAVDNKGSTPLKAALMKEEYGALEELLKHGAVEDIEDSKTQAVTKSSNSERLTINFKVDENTAHTFLSQLKSMKEGSSTGPLSVTTTLDQTAASSLFFQVVSLGDSPSLSAMLKGGFPVDIVDSNGYTALHIAASKGHVEIVRELIAKGACANAVGYDLKTPLHAAAQHGQSEAASALLQLGGELSLSMVAGNLCTPLHFAVIGGYVQTVRVLLSAGCSPHVLATNGQSVLHLAAECGHNELVRFFVELGLNANMENDDGLTPLHAAAACGEIGVILELLTLGAGPSMTMNAGTYGTPLHQAAQNGHQSVVSALVSAGCSIDVLGYTGRNILHSSAQGGHVELIVYLIGCGLNVNSTDYEGCTPLHRAAYNGRIEAVRKILELGGAASMLQVSPTSGTPLHTAVFAGHKETATILLNAGCPIDVLDVSGKSALHAASAAGHVEIVAMLVEYGIDVNGSDVSGWTALHAGARHGQTEVVRLLLSLGARPSLFKVAIGGTPLHQAVLGGQSEIVSMLLKAGCSVNVLDGEGRTPLHLAALKGYLEISSILINARCPVDVLDNDNASLFHFAAEGDIIELLCALTDIKMDVNRLDRFGWTPLHRAAYKGKLGSVKKLLTLGAKESMMKVGISPETPLHLAAHKGHEEVVSTLLCAGCSVDMLDIHGRTSLHFAAGGGQVELVQKFIEIGLNVNSCDMAGCTPLHAAAYNGRLEVVRELLKLVTIASARKIAGRYGSPLHMAALGGHKEISRALLDWGCPVHTLNSQGESVLHFCAQNHSKTGNADAIELLVLFVERGLDVNTGDCYGLTPLHLASCQGEVGAVRELLKLGADPKSCAGANGTPFHLAVTNQSLEVLTELSQTIGPSKLTDHSAPGGSRQTSPLDCPDAFGATPLLWAAEYGKVEALKYLVEQHCSVCVRTNYGLSLFEHAILGGHMDKLSEISTACNMGDCGGKVDLLTLTLQNKSLLDCRKLLLLGAFTGDPLVIEVLSNEEHMFAEAARHTFLETLTVLKHNFGDESRDGNIYHQIGLPDNCPLTPLHISLILLKYTTESHTFTGSIVKGVKNYEVYIAQLLAHPLSRFLVRELFPNGLSPLDVAHQFNYHTISTMIENAGGQPGLWGNLPREVQQQCINAFLPMSALMGHGNTGLEGAQRVVSHLFGGHLLPSVTTREGLLDTTPDLKLIVKHIIPRLQRLDCWFKAGIILDFKEDELLQIRCRSKSDDSAYEAVMCDWLKRSQFVTWKTLFGAIGCFEKKVIIDDMTDQICKELSSINTGYSLGIRAPQMQDCYNSTMLKSPRVLESFPTVPAGLHAVPTSHENILQGGKPSDVDLANILSLVPLWHNLAVRLGVPINQVNALQYQRMGGLLALQHWRNGLSGEEYPSTWTFLLETVKRTENLGPHVAEQMKRQALSQCFSSSSHTYPCKTAPLVYSPQTPLSVLHVTQSVSTIKCSFEASAKMTQPQGDSFYVAAPSELALLAVANEIGGECLDLCIELGVPIPQATAFIADHPVLALNYWLSGQSGEEFPTTWGFLLEAVARICGPKISSSLERKARSNHKWSQPQRNF
jgi:ankyrin repeat protein